MEIDAPYTATQPLAERPKILVVDDEIQVLRAIEDMLEDDFDMITQTSPQAAIDWLKVNPALSVILSDQRMPDMQGDQFLMAARTFSPATRLMITGYADIEVVIRAVNDGQIFGYISKPWNPAALRLAITKAVEHYDLNRALKESEERFRAFMQYTPGRASMKDEAGRYTYVNETWLRGLNKKNFEILGRMLEEVSPAGHAKKVRDIHQKVLATHRPASHDMEFITDGMLHWWFSTHFPIPNAQGQIRQVGTIAIDVTEQKLQAQKITRLNRVHAVLSGINTLIVRVRSRQELFDGACHIAVNHGGFGVAWVGEVDLNTSEIRPVAMAGETAERLIALKGTSPGDIIAGASALGRAVRDKKPEVCNDLEADFTGNGRRKEAIRQGFRSLIALPLIVEDTVIATITLYTTERNFFDKEELKLLSELSGDISFALDHINKVEKLNYLAYYDALTGLPNRTLLHNNLTHALHNAEQKNENLMLLLIDLRRFRQVNETFGRAAGDALLQEFAERCKKCWPDAANVAHIAIDCFAGVLPQNRDTAQLAHFLEEIFSGVIRRPFIIQDTEVRLAMTIGISKFPEDGKTPDALLKNAEAALKKAKAAGESYLFYQPEMNAKVAETLRLESKMRQALEKEQFILHYQPKINLANGDIIGFEALIRWNDPETGLVPPLRFIPLLEETGMILDVGNWAIRKALEQYSEWEALGLRPPRIAVNVSPIQLKQKNFVSTVEDAIREHPQKSQGLDLEITESLIMEDIEGNIEKLKAIRDMGVKIAIDDFGTGYSSLAYLAKLPVNSLKIDRSFIITMIKQPVSMTIVSTIVSLANSLDLTVIAEGVDAEEQREVLRNMKCDEMQGYLFSKPLPAPDIEAMLRKNRK